MRTLGDCDRIAGYARKAGRAAVIGGGLLGLEAARGLAQHGAQVHLVHRSGCLMSAQLDQNASDVLKREVEMMGLCVHLDKITTALLGEESVTGLQFKDGTELRCDMVVLACGVVPNVELSRACGLPTAKATLVDDQMRVPGERDVFAVGECAEHRGQIYGLVAPVWEQARVVAQILSGHKPDAIYEGSNLSTKLKVMGVELASIGEANEREGDEVITYAEPRRGRYKKIIIRDGRLVGAILLGDSRKAAFLTQTFDRAMPCPEERTHLLFDIGKAASSDASTLPDDATVCNCNGVSAGKTARLYVGRRQRFSELDDSNPRRNRLWNVQKQPSRVSEVAGMGCFFRRRKKFAVGSFVDEHSAEPEVLARASSRSVSFVGA
jgi:nitrite reductase (NADH) large subunit